MKAALWRRVLVRAPGAGRCGLRRHASRRPWHRPSGIDPAVAKRPAPVGSGRSFFSWFRGENVLLASGETKRQRGRETGESPGPSEWEDFYRRPVTRELWEEFRDERKTTRSYLSSATGSKSSSDSSNSNSSTDYRVLAEELQAGINAAWNDEDRSPPAEYGPGGRWTYRFEWIETESDPDAHQTPRLRRVYQRYPAPKQNDSSSSPSSSPPFARPRQPEPQVVLELADPTDEILSMSLTPDETCVACLVAGGERASGDLVVRGIDSGTEVVVPCDEWLQRVATRTKGKEEADPAGPAPAEIVGLEWGPNLRSGEGSFCHSLYLVLADATGRPDAVVLCRIDPSTLEPSSGEAEPIVPVYRSEDPSVMVDAQRTKGCSFVAIKAASKNSSEVLLSPPPVAALAAGTGSENPPEIEIEDEDEHVPWAIPVRPRQDGVVYHVDAGTDGDVVLLTSDERGKGGGNYVLSETTLESLPLAADTTRSSPGNGGGNAASAAALASGGGGFFVEDMDLFRTHIVLYERSLADGDQRIRVLQRTNHLRGTVGDRLSDGTEVDNPCETVLDLSFASKQQRKNNSDSGGKPTEQSPSLEAPLCWSKLSPVGNMCFDARFFRFELESPVDPGVVYEYDFDTQEITRVSGQESVRDASDQTKENSEALSDTRVVSFRKEKVMVESLDGTKVPLSLFCKEGGNAEQEGSGAEHAGTEPQTVVLVGYGAYGEPMDLGYHPGWKPLLDRGAVLAFAHTRGGGDLGRAWYTGGRRDRKEKSIEDYEACAVYLRTRFGPSCSLVAKAVSAGGVLVGAAVNRTPGLFDRVVLTNAFLDVLRTMERADLFLTEHEHDEFGNPARDSSAAAGIRSYCPVSNLDGRAQMEDTETRFLLIGSLDDRNVPYWNATLYFRKLMLGGSVDCGDRAFLELQLRGGHNFSSENRTEVLALETAFILKDDGPASVLPPSG